MNKKATIMIVDDSKTILQTARQFLEPDYRVIGVEDGFMALAEIVEAQPDILFLDIMMPRLDGYSACLAIKSNPDFKDLPIVMLSSKDSPFDKARGAMMGCNDYLTKPFSKESFLASIARHLPSDQASEEKG